MKPQNINNTSPNTTHKGLPKGWTSRKVTQQKTKKIRSPIRNIEPKNKQIKLKESQNKLFKKNTRKGK